MENEDDGTPIMTTEYESDEDMDETVSVANVNLVTQNTSMRGGRTLYQESPANFFRSSTIYVSTQPKTPTGS